MRFNCPGVRRMSAMSRGRDTAARSSALAADRSDRVLGAEVSAADPCGADGPCPAIYPPATPTSSVAAGKSQLVFMVCSDYNQRAGEMLQTFGVECRKFPWAG